MKSNALTVVVGVVALAALVLGFMALNQAKVAQQLALSEIFVEEVNSLSTPVFDAEKNAYSYITLYDISVANMSGPAVRLKSVKKSTAGTGFIALLKGEDVVSAAVNEKAFVTDLGSNAVKNDPRLLKTIGQQDMGQAAAVDLGLAPGEVKVIHIGLTLSPYDSAMESLANLCLVCFELEFDNGKSYTFQRGFPIFPLKSQAISQN